MVFLTVFMLPTLFFEYFTMKYPRKLQATFQWLTQMP